jgi:hypothetical protein
MSAHQRREFLKLAAGVIAPPLNDPASNADSGAALLEKRQRVCWKRAPNLLLESKVFTEVSQSD